MASGDPQNTNPDLLDGSGSKSNQSKKRAAKKAKAGSLKKMTAKEQSERFINTARELGADEYGDTFNAAIDLVIRPKQKQD